MNTDIKTKTDKLVSFISFLNLRFNSTERKSYNNLGATLADTILQSGLHYKTVVWPRVDYILKFYTEFRKTSEIQDLVNEITTSTYLNWKGIEKINRFNNLLRLLRDHYIQTENDLKEWLSYDSTEYLLLSQRGIGPKTLDYIKLLVGIQSIPIDRHLLRFANMGEIYISSYQEASSIYKNVSEELNIDYLTLDRTIWSFMSEVMLSK